MTRKQHKDLIELVRELRLEGCNFIKLKDVELHFDERKPTLAELTGFPDVGEFVPKKTIKEIIDENAEGEEEPEIPRSVLEDPELGLPSLPNYPDES